MIGFAKLFIQKKAYFWNSMGDGGGGSSAERKAGKSGTVNGIDEKRSLYLSSWVWNR